MVIWPRRGVIITAVSNYLNQTVDPEDMGYSPVGGPDFLTIFNTAWILVWIPGSSHTEHDESKSKELGSQSL